MSIDDRRNDKTRPWGYVVCTDGCLSGWGLANGGRSLYALAVNTSEDIDAVLGNAGERTDMRRPRIVLNLRKDGTPSVRMRPGDHLAVVDRGTAARWYERGGFARKCN